MFRLKNKEFTFDVDVSELGCGINGALYFVEMEEDGGLKYPGNKAGPNYGTGYCDAQCPHDIKWIYGEPNMEDWETGSDANSGIGKYGTCCFELDIWEANSMASAYTNHPCGNIQGEVSNFENSCLILEDRCLTVNCPAQNIKSLLACQVYEDNYLFEFWLDQLVGVCYVKKEFNPSNPETRLGTRTEPHN